MKITTDTRVRRGPQRILTAQEAVEYVADRASRREPDRPNRARTEALRAVIGELLGAMIANGALRANQVVAILNYDVEAED